MTAVLLLAACKSDKEPAAKPGGEPAKAPAPAPAPAPDKPKLEPRAGGPTQEQCDKFADHTGTFMADSLLPPNATDEQKKYVAQVVTKDRDTRLKFCLQALEPAEVECVLQAVDFPALSACERFRRQVPKDLADRKEVTADDCERVFLRYKQFMMTDGIPGERVDQDKDQVVRACLEKAKPGTVACFITAVSYEEAKRCP